MMFVIKNLSRLLERPAALQERVFEHMFQAAEIARFSPQELSLYEDSVKAYRDINNAIVTARKEGMEKGMEEGMEKGKQMEKIEIAKKLLGSGLPVDQVVQITGLSAEAIEKL